MPELPEVETTRRGILPYVEGRQIRQVVVRERRLRWPVSPRLARELPGRRVLEVGRRSKYLLFRTAGGTVILHLGMSGSLRVVTTATAPARHDHVDFVLPEDHILRLRDPRRFGAVLWTRRDPDRHRLLAELGPEPLSAEFTGELLYERSRGRKRPIRDFLLDGKIVAGVGNIYANEAAFHAGVHPGRAAGRLSRQRYEGLAQALRAVLRDAIDMGGTTLRDFAREDGRPGYFQQELFVYGREGKPCLECGTEIRRNPRGGRSYFYCRRCQR